MSTSSLPASTRPLFGRSWNLQVLSAAGSGQQQQTLLTASQNAWEPEALRISFDVSQPGYKALWFADIAIYNLDPAATAQNSAGAALIAQGSEVSLAVGYQANGTPTEIFRGQVFQMTWERENIVDTKLTLRCVTGLPWRTRNFISLATKAGQTQWQIVQQMAQGAKTSIPIAYCDPAANFNQTVLPRSKTIFGTPDQLFGQIADQNNMTTFIGPNGLYLGRLENPGAPVDVIYAPPLILGQQPEANEAQLTRSIVGTPQQTPGYGINLRVLCDPRIKMKLPPMQVQIQNSIIRQAERQIGKLPSLLTQDGVYMVGGVRHYGDTRENDWYTEITGVISVAGRAKMLGIGGKSSLKGT